MRKKVLALIIILCLALGALAAFAACDNTGKLDTPSGFTLNKETQTLSWTPVDNAYAYDFYVTDEQGNRSNVNNIRVQEDEDGNVITPSQSLAGITASGTYTIHVQALANPDELDVSGNPVHQDSDVAEYTYVRGNRYGNPQNVSATYTVAEENSDVWGLRVTFNAVEGAAGYTVQILNGSTLLTEVDTDSVSNWFETYIEKDSGIMPIHIDRRHGKRHAAPFKSAHHAIFVHQRNQPKAEVDAGSQRFFHNCRGVENRYDRRRASQRQRAYSLPKYRKIC